MNNGNDLNRFLDAMPGWLIQLRQMKQRAEQVKSQQDIQKERTELERKRINSVIENAQMVKNLKHRIRIMEITKLLSEEPKKPKPIVDEIPTKIKDGYVLRYVDKLTGRELSRTSISEAGYNKRVGITPTITKKPTELEKLQRKAKTLKARSEISEYKKPPTEEERLETEYNIARYKKGIMPPPKKPSDDDLEILNAYHTLQPRIDKIKREYDFKKKTSEMRKEKNDYIRAEIGNYMGYDPESKAKRMTWERIVNRAINIYRKYPDFNLNPPKEPATQPQQLTNPEQRFNELIESGTPEDEAYRIMREEGYK